MSYKVEQLLERKDVKEEIIESLKKTKETRREHVFNFCIRNGEIVPTDIEEGKQHNVDAESKCTTEDSKVIGAFHTHTKLTNNEDVVPSPRDIMKSVGDDLEFFCIGGNIEDRGIIRCFNKNDLLLEINKVLDITKKDVTGENVSRATRHIVGRMLSDIDYLNEHSYITLYRIET